MAESAYQNLHPVLRRPPRHANETRSRFDPEVTTYVRAFIRATGISSQGGDTRLCKRCQAMFSARGLFHLFTGGKLYSRGQGGGFKHSKALSFASRLGCDFCQFVWREDYNGDTIQPRKIRRLCDFAEGLDRSRPQDAWVCFRALVDADGPWRGLAVRVESSKGKLLWTTAQDLIVTTEEGSILAPHVNSRPINWSGLDEQSSTALRALLNDCQINHSQCKPSGPTSLPTRLLRLITKPGGLDVQLFVASEGQTGLYAALSYCWGGPQEFRLLKTNFDSFSTTPVDLEQLPKTLQDSVHATASLGLQFIWIDALCIVQDDDDDKAREIGNMCSIYEQSAVTIVAATASSVKDGFLEPATKISKRHSTCSIKLHLQQSNSHKSYGITFVPVQNQHIDHLPINKRGWTFQESYIPPRLLVFGDREPFLRCRTKDATPMALTAILYKTGIEPRRNIDYALPKHIREEQHIPYKLRDMWRYIVESYTERRFSFAADRLVALQGVVDFLKHRFDDDQCYFGVWKSIAVGCLLWTVHEDEPKVARVLTAPTWSWLSVPHSVHMDNLELLGSYLGDAIVDFDEAHPKQIKVTCAVVPLSEMADDELEYWQDLQDEYEEDSRDYWTSRFALVMAKTANGTALGIVTVGREDGVHIRRGATEINNADAWLTRPKETVILE